MFDTCLFSDRHDLATAARVTRRVVGHPRRVSTAVARQAGEKQLGRFPFDFESQRPRAGRISVAEQQVRRRPFIFQQPANRDRGSVTDGRVVHVPGEPGSPFTVARTRLTEDRWSFEHRAGANAKQPKLPGFTDLARGPRSSGSCPRGHVGGFAKPPIFEIRHAMREMMARAYQIVSNTIQYFRRTKSLIVVGILLTFAGDAVMRSGCGGSGFAGQMAENDAPELRRNDPDGPGRYWTRPVLVAYSR